AVDSRHVDLSDLLLRCMPDFQSWQIAELDSLPSDRERAGDHRLRGNDRRDRRQRDERIETPFRGETIKRVLQGCGIPEQYRAPPEIVEHQWWKHEPKPGWAQCATAEMPYIGIECLGAGYGEKHRAEHDKSAPRRVEKQREPVRRVECQQDARVLRDPPNSE